MPLVFFDIDIKCLISRTSCDKIYEHQIAMIIFERRSLRGGKENVARHRAE